MTWLFINSGACPAEWNMAFDIRLAHAVRDGLLGPVLRLYGWQPHAVSLGFHQRETEFDRSAIDRDGLHLVRRPTGGKAILHADEITYSVAMPVGPLGPREIYRWLNIGLLKGLELLGLHPVLAQADGYSPAHFRSSVSAPCFSSSARSEIQIDGKKIVGSAQRRYGSAILQHGSIMLGPAHRDLVRYLAAGDPAAAAEMAASLAEKTIDAQTALRRIVTFDEAAAAIREGFSSALGLALREPSEGEVGSLLAVPELVGEYC